MKFKQLVHKIGIDRLHHLLALFSYHGEYLSENFLHIPDDVVQMIRR